ncbi:MAG: class I SAM-dependent methyltransferase [Acidiferrobacter sp.]
MEPTQRQLLAALEAAGIQGKSLLEIGCGVGYVHQRLLLMGAASAVGIDLSPAMLQEAEALAARQGLAEHTRYQCGDFREMASDIAMADVTLLDKVVCCYPDAEGLLAATTAHTKDLCALTFPRAHWVNRVGARVATAVLRLVGSTYRPFVHDPRAIDAWIGAAGFRRISEDHTAIWLTRVYRRV